ncbi:hypothetical protein GCM10027037_18380 [Mucilaginibacter koreensis]
MKVLLTGAGSYVGAHLVPVLLQKGHEVLCLVRDEKLFRKQNPWADKVKLITGDLLRTRNMQPLPQDIDAAFYLTASLTQTSAFAGLEALAAENFIGFINETNCQQIISLGDIDDEESDTARSRRHVEEILYAGNASLTVLRTSLIIGPHSIASEMLNGLTEKNPIVIAHNWAQARVQPIALCDVLGYMEGCLLNKLTYNTVFTIGGPEVLTIKEMIHTYAEVCKQARVHMVLVPLVSKQLSTYWLNYLTPISFTAAQSLIENLEHDSIAQDDSLTRIIQRKLMPYREALQQSDELMHQLASN